MQGSGYAPGTLNVSPAPLVVLHRQRPPRLRRRRPELPGRHPGPLPRRRRGRDAVDLGLPVQRRRRLRDQRGPLGAEVAGLHDQPERRRDLLLAGDPDDHAGPARRRRQQRLPAVRRPRTRRLSGAVLGVLNGDDVSASSSPTATQFSEAGSYPITATLSGSRLADYSIDPNVAAGANYTPGTLTVNRRATTTAVVSSNPSAAPGGGGDLHGDRPRRPGGARISRAAPCSSGSTAPTSAARSRSTRTGRRPTRPRPSRRPAATRSRPSTRETPGSSPAPRRTRPRSCSAAAPTSSGRP